MAHVRTATLLGGLAIALAHASVTSAQNWYNPDINSAYSAGPRPPVNALAYQAKSAMANHASGWVEPDAAWQGSVNQTPSVQASSANPSGAAAYSAATSVTPQAVAASLAGPSNGLPSANAAPMPLPAGDGSQATRLPSTSSSASLAPASLSSASLAPSTSQPSGMQGAAASLAPTSVASRPDMRVACAPGTNCAAPTGSGQLVDPVAGWGSAAVPAGGFGDAAAASGMQQTNHGIFFRWDRLYFTMTDPGSVAIGDPTQAGVGTSNGIPYPFINSLDTGFIGGSDLGDRIEFGFIDPNQRNGWVASVLMLDRSSSITATGGALLFNDPTGMLLGFQDADGNNIDDDINLNNIYGRFGQDLGTPSGGAYVAPFDGTPDTPAAQDNGDLVTWIPVFDQLTATAYTDVSGLEVSYVHGFGGLESRLCGFNWLFGVRYLDIDDRFRVQGTGGLYDETDINTTTQNLVIGPQMGLVMAKAAGPWSLGAELRYLPGVNVIQGRQTGSFATNAGTTINGNNFNRPLNLHATAIANNFEDETFSNVVEWRIDSGYALTQWAAIRAGYTGMFMSEIVRGVGNVTYTLPSIGFTSTNGEDMTLHALTLGLEFYR